MSMSSHRCQASDDEGTHFFESFSLSSRARILASISAAFGQEVVFVRTVVAENNTRRGKMEDSHASANGCISTIPITNNRWICLGDTVMLLV